MNVYANEYMYSYVMVKRHYAFYKMWFYKISTNNGKQIDLLFLTIIIIINLKDKKTHFKR